MVVVCSQYVLFGVPQGSVVVIRFVHSGTISCRRWTWTLTSSVRRRLAGLCQRDSRRCLGCCRPAVNISGGRRDLAESKSSPFEPGQNTGYVTWLSTTARQARYARLVMQCTGLGDGS